MKLLIVIVALFALAQAVPVPDHTATIVRSESDVGPETWSFASETSDGTKHSAQGNVKALGGHEHDAIVVHGSYEWVDEHTGEHYVVTYVADENGYQPTGKHLPTV